MLENMILKKIDELEKEKYKKIIAEERLKEIDLKLKQYRGMLEGLRKEQ